MTTLLLVDPFAITSAFRSALNRLAPDVEVRVWQPGGDPRCDLLVVWALPGDFPAVAASTRAVFCFGAGIDQLTRDPRVPETMPIVRLLDEGQAAHMANYVAAAALAHLVGLPDYRRAQDDRRWTPLTGARRLPSQMAVAVLGAGFIGARVVARLAELGFQLRCWSRRERQLDGAACFHGFGRLGVAVKHVDLLVNVLALTAETAGLIDAALLARLKPGAALINIGRGGHVDEAALRTALDSGRLGHAWLDTVDEEPPPRSHWLWSHRRVTLTPHVAGPPDPEGAARSLIAATRAIIAGKRRRALSAREIGRPA